MPASLAGLGYHTMGCKDRTYLLFYSFDAIIKIDRKIDNWEWVGKARLKVPSSVFFFKDIFFVSFASWLYYPCAMQFLPSTFSKNFICLMIYHTIEHLKQISTDSSYFYFVTRIMEWIPIVLSLYKCSFFLQPSLFEKLFLSDDLSN